MEIDWNAIDRKWQKKWLENNDHETDSNNKQHKRTIHKLKYKKNSLQSFTVEIEADGGIPIKRFVDGFNIIPSISSILGIQCSCEKFDINQIYLSK